jgi:putative membrane protein
VKIEPWVLVKGILMGAADIVPGVSGGTVAFITGIYERLLFALKAIVPCFFKLLQSRDISTFWRQIDGMFLLTLFSGILISVISLAKVITYLLVAHPVPLWAGFFGLIVASVYVVAQEVTVWDSKRLLSLLVGAAIAWLITQMAPATIEQSALNIFLSGSLAICAMVLPGISGSFILVMLGTYSFILSAIKGLDIYVLGLFALGCFVGLLSIANILVWAFSRYKELTLSLLTGFMLGALGKVWPWKTVISYRQNSHGELVPLLERSVLPETYSVLTGEPSQILLALACSLLAAISVVLLAHFGRVNEK